MNIQIKNNNQIILNFLSWCVAILPIALIFSNALSDIIISTAGLFFIFFSFNKKSWAWLNESWVKIGFIIYFWLIISSFFAIDNNLAFSRSLTWIRFIIFAASLQFLFLNNAEYKKRLITFALIALIYVNFEMFMEYFTGSSLYSKILHNFFYIPSGPFPFSGGPHVISGPFKDAPKSGIFLAYFILPTILGFAKLLKTKLSKNIPVFFIIFFIIINSFLIYLSGHRASILSFTISLFLFFVFIFLKKKKITTIFVIALISVGAIFYQFNLVQNDKLRMNNPVTKTLLEIKDYSNSAYGSLSFTSFKMFKTYPVFGIGLKNYRVACEKDEFLSEGHLGTGYGVSPWKGHYNQELKKRFEATCSSHPHNLYLTWLAETGFIGFFLFSLFLFVAVKNIYKYKKNIKNEIIVFAILITLIPKILPMMPSLNFFSNWNAICFWLLIGWLFSFLPKNKKS